MAHSGPTVNKVFYAFGYFADEAPTNFVTWSYNTARGPWDIVETKGQPEYLAYGMYSGIGYCLEGFQNNLTSNWSAGEPQYSSNLVTFGMISRTYTNSTGIDDKGRGEGLMVFKIVAPDKSLAYASPMNPSRPSADTPRFLWT